MAPILTMYLIGTLTALLLAVAWSFILDKNKPPTVKETLLKFLARGLFLLFIFSVILGFLYLAIGLFRG